MRRTIIRSAAVAGIALLTAIAVAACGGGGSASKSSTSSSAAAAAAATPPATGASGASGATGGAAALAARRQALETCFKKAGVTLPSRPFGGTGGTGASGRFRFGATGATGAGGGSRFFGGTGASGPRGPGFLGGGRAGAFASNPKLAQAFAKCAASVGGFSGRRAGSFVPQGSKQRAAIISYAACMKSHGVDLPKPNFSGRGSVFGTKVNETSTAFRTANTSCEHLLTFLAPHGATGASGSASG